MGKVEGSGACGGGRGRHGHRAARSLLLASAPSLRVAWCGEACTATGRRVLWMIVAVLHCTAVSVDDAARSL